MVQIRAKRAGTIFARPNQAAARAQLRRVAATLEKRYPKAAALLAEGALLMEQNDEWAVGRRYFSAESMAAIDQGNTSVLLMLPGVETAAG